MRCLIGTLSHEPSLLGARKFQRPTRVGATKVMPRLASQTAAPSLSSTVRTKSMAYSLPGSPPTTTIFLPLRRRGRSGISVTTTCVNVWPLAAKSM
jgi:hypothetical protein